MQRKYDAAFKAKVASLGIGKQQRESGSMERLSEEGATSERISLNRGVQIAQVRELAERFDLTRRPELVARVLRISVEEAQELLTLASRCNLEEVTP